MLLKKPGINLTCKALNKWLNIRERVEVVKVSKDAPSLPLLPCKSLLSVKKKPYSRKNIKNADFDNLRFGFGLLIFLKNS